MVIGSTRLLLKEISIDDVVDIHHLHSYPEVDEFNTLGIPNDIEETKVFIQPYLDNQKSKKRKLFFWKIVERESDDFIGIAGMTLSNNKFQLGEIYYKILPTLWGNGYATEVSKALIRAGFDDFHLHKVEAGVATENVKSIRVLEKSGMIREGLRRKILPIRGKWKDNYHYAIVEDDPRDY